MYCEKCGSQITEGSKFCVACGAKFEGSSTVQDATAQEAAAVIDSTVTKESVQAAEKPASPQPAPVQQTHTRPSQSVPPKAAESQTQPVQPSYQTPQPVNRRKPASTSPIPVWKFIGIFILMGIPIVGYVMLLVWAFGGSCNINTRNYARAVLIMMVVMIILLTVGYFTVWPSVSEILQGYMVQ